MAKIELEGVDELLADIRKKLGNASQRLENKALRKAGEPIAEAMKANVNVSKYAYRNHIRDDIRVSGVRRDKLAGTRYVLIGGTKKTKWRWHFLEYGTSRHKPYPFVEPAFEEEKDSAQAILADEFRKGLMK